MDNTKASWDPLIEYELLVVDTGPAPGDYAVAGTLTGAGSSVTSIVVAKISDTDYIIKDRSGDYDDGEVISDTTNSLDCAAGYPIITPLNVFGLMALDAGLSIAIRNDLTAIREKAKVTGLLGSGDMAKLGGALEFLGKRHTRQI